MGSACVRVCVVQTCLVTYLLGLREVTYCFYVEISAFLNWD